MQFYSLNWRKQGKAFSSCKLSFAIRPQSARFLNLFAIWPSSWAISRTLPKLMCSQIMTSFSLGLLIFRPSLLQDPQTYALWSQYLHSLYSVDRQYHTLFGAFTNLFAKFSNPYYPISLHAHATDALLLTPSPASSLILWQPVR